MSNQKNITKVSTVILLAIIAFAIVWIVSIKDDGSDTLGGPREMPPQPIGCTQEAKLCPDGSSVGKTGPNCEFAECPKNKTPDQKNVIVEIENESFSFEIRNDWKCSWDDVFYKTVCDATSNPSCPSCPARGLDLKVSTFHENSTEVLKGFDSNSLYNHSELNKIKIGNYDAYEFIETDTRRAQGYYAILIETPKGSLKFNFFKIPTKESLTEEEKRIISSFKPI